MLRYTAIVYFTFATALQAQTVFVNSRIVAVPVLPPRPPGIHFEISKDGQPPPFHTGACSLVECDTEIDFQYDGTKLKVDNVLLDEGSDWFLVEPGDLFSQVTIRANQFPAINNYYPLQGSEVTVGSGDFYLGVRTGIGFGDVSRRTAYGWVHLRPVDGILTMVENVMSYNSRGIIVGTTTAVPEPATWVTVAVAGLAFVCRRRRFLRTGRQRLLCDFP